MRNISIISVLALVLNSSVANAIGTEDTKALPVTASVASAINMTKVDDLRFGEGFVGDAAKTVAPADDGAGSFSIVGEANRPFSVTFLSASIKLLRSGGAPGNASDEIEVANFTHNAPASVGNGGTATFKVGGTREALLSKGAGSYVGAVNVKVAY